VHRTSVDTGPDLAIRALGVGEGALRGHEDEGVQQRIEGGNARQRVLRQFRRAQLARAELMACFGYRQLVQGFCHADPYP
jgi:hypothetical protein